MIQVAGLDVVPLIHSQDDRRIFGEAGHVVQPVPGLSGQVLVAVADDHHVTGAAGQEAPVHGVHDLLAAKVPKVDVKIIIRLTDREVCNVNASVVSVGYVPGQSIVVDSLNGITLPYTAIAQEDDFGFADGNLGCCVIALNEFTGLFEETDRLNI